MQADFLDEMSLDATTALIKFNLAPLSTRRDISALGLMHRVVLGLAPPQLTEFFRSANAAQLGRGWAYNFQWHNRQLHDAIDGSTNRTMERSIFSLVYSYNCLPQHVVEHQSVKSFQRCLQNAVKTGARAGHADWASLLKFGARSNGVASFRQWF